MFYLEETWSSELDMKSIETQHWKCVCLYVCEGVVRHEEKCLYVRGLEHQCGQRPLSEKE